MSAVELSEQQWGQMMNILATTREHPWTVTNPLLMEIGNQLRAQQLAASNPPNIAAQDASNPPNMVGRGGIRLDANGKEVRHE
jgi:hypothetical protein